MPSPRQAFGKNRLTFEIGLNVKAIYFYVIALVGFFGLFALLMLWYTVLAPSTSLPTALMLLITVTPLLLPMRGLLDRNRKSCAWAAYISLIYFVHGTVEAYANSAVRPYALMEVLFSLMVFLGATFYIRQFSKEG